jgi:pimeloyl-ACP methyl ester carboxylesterase
MLKSRRHVKSWVRRKITAPRNESGARFGLALDSDWQQAPPDKPIVVLLHGLNSNTKRISPMLTLPRRAGFPCAEFNYPNDQPIAESATLLAQELKTLAVENPDRRVSLLSHSMGGLVAREAVENPQLDPGNVVQLIMVSPPNQGSALARMAPFYDLWEYTLQSNAGQTACPIQAAIEDGFAEAATDLQPGSEFLARLNSRPRNPKVAYTIILGTTATLTTPDVASVRGRIKSAAAQSAWVQFFHPCLDDWLADVDEVIDGRGDGAVAVKRGQLAGVPDIVSLPFRHDDMMDRNPADDVAQAHEIIMKRLNGPLATNGE